MFAKRRVANLRLECANHLQGFARLRNVFDDALPWVEALHLQVVDQLLHGRRVGPHVLALDRDEATAMRLDELGAVQAVPFAVCLDLFPMLGREGNTITAGTSELT